MTGQLSDPRLCRLVIAVFVKRYGDGGGILSVSQAELDAVAYARLLEGCDENGSLLMKVDERAKND